MLKTRKLHYNSIYLRTFNCKKKKYFNLKNNYLHLHKKAKIGHDPRC